MEHSLNTVTDCIKTIAKEAKKAKCDFVSGRAKYLYNLLKENKEFAERYNAPVLKIVCLRIIENITSLERRTSENDRNIQIGLIEFDFNALSNALPGRY